MELFLQFGHGMMEHCRALLAAWGGGTAILSPRDLSEIQLRRLGGQINALPNARCMIDPQFFLPHADHKVLRGHPYWPENYETGGFWGGPELTSLLRRLFDLNDAVGTSEVILPGLYASAVDDDWIETQRCVLAEARDLAPNRDLVGTIALSAEAIRDAGQVTRLLENAETWNARTYYVVCEHPRGQYLVDDPNWLANVLDLAAGLRLVGSRVLLGYCTHQMLAAGAAKVNAIASGTWMNVRSFPPGKFNSAYQDEIRQRSTWYYCPQALSEYTTPFLDIAQRLGVLPLMAPQGGLGAGHADNLFAGPQPTTVGFTEGAAFRHYLCALRAQAAAVEAGSFDDAVRDHRRALDEAQAVLACLRNSNVTGRLRDFGAIVDVNRAGVGLFEALRGPTLRHLWDRI